MLKKTYRFRLLLLCFLSLLAFAAIEARLYQVQVLQHMRYIDRANDQQYKAITLIPRRGDILDRNGTVLATSHVTDQVTLDTSKLKDYPDDLIDSLIYDLSGLLQVKDSTLRGYFAKPGQHILYRKASSELSAQTKELVKYYNLPADAIFFPPDSQREYPNLNLASHVLGYTKIDDSGDNVGDAGIELKYDEWLRGKYQTDEVEVNSRQRALGAVDDDIFNKTFGANVTLTLDRQIQTFTEKALARGVSQYFAKGGVAVVMDVPTGEILALASCPDFDPSKAHQGLHGDEMKNRPLTDPIEIGSVMKIITASLLLDNGLVSLTEDIDCHNGTLAIDGRVLKDDHPMGVVKFPMAFAESSNIALATLGLRLEPNLYYAGLTRFGLGSKTGIDLPGEYKGTLRPPETWSQLSRTSLPIGYESGTTAIQVVTALATIGNDGVRMKPHIVKEVRSHSGELLQKFDPEPVTRVVSVHTAETVRTLMKGVVDIGTGVEAQVPGYNVGGKTGTTAKSNAKKEEHKYVAGFAGLIPIEKPRLAIYIYVDEPQIGSIYGGKIAAPIFNEIAMQAAPLLEIPPNDVVAFNAARDRMNGIVKAGGAGTTLTMAMALPSPTPAAPTMALPLEMTRPKVTNGRPMPDCLGLTIDDAWTKLAKAGIKAQVLGSGVVVRQEPTALTPVAANQMVTIVLALPSQAASTATGLAETSATRNVKKAPVKVVPNAKR